MNVFKTIAIPANLAAKAQQIAHDLGYPERGMFTSAFGNSVGVMSTGILDSESAILQAESVLHAAIIAATPASTITLQDCIDFVTARDLTEAAPIPRQAALVTEVADAAAAPAWVQPQGAHDAYSDAAIVQHGGKSWRSLTAANVWTPGVSGWRLVWGQSTGFPPWVQPTGAHDAYKLNDKVSHKGDNWNNTGSNANVWEPGVFGWTKIV